MFQQTIQTREIVFMSESVTLHVDCLYDEATEAVNSRAALSASTPIQFWLEMILAQRRGFETDPNLWIFQ
jgi:hypothetical protein